MASLSSKYYSVGGLGGYSFDVGVGDGKCGVVPSTTNLPPRTLIVGLMVAIFCDIRVGTIHP